MKTHQLDARNQTFASGPVTYISTSTSTSSSSSSAGQVWFDMSAIFQIEPEGELVMLGLEVNLDIIREVLMSRDYTRRVFF